MTHTTIREFSSMFRIPALAVASLLVFHAPLTTSARAAEEQAANIAKIIVTGEGEVSLAPDLAILSLGVTREGKTAREALTQNNSAMAGIIESMKASRIASKDLQTSNFSIHPRYSQHRPKKHEEPKPPTIIGYVVSNNLTVRVRDLSMLGEIIDKSVSLGVNTGGNIRFGNDNPQEAITTARINAVKNAQQKARTLLEAAGARLGPIIEMSESSHRPAPVAMARGRMMADNAMAELVPVEGGENTYRVNVNITWQIDQ